MIKKPLLPMLAVLAPQPFDSERHFFEPKLDGVRALAFIDKGEVRFQGRRLTDLTPQFPELLSLFQQVKAPGVVLDGEIVCLDKRGIPSFEAIQERVPKTRLLDIQQAARRFPATYMVFDILYHQGEEVMSHPLWQRRQLLGEIFLPDHGGRLLKFVEREGIALFKAAQELGLEGIMAKDRESRYLSGKRSSAWLKIKTKKEGTFFIVGLTYGEGERQDSFGSLVLGVERGGRLYYTGLVGTGFTHAQLEEIRKLAQPLKTPNCPLADFPQIPNLLFWCQPQLQAEVRYLEMTSEGRLRTPSFRRLVKG